MKLVLRSDFTTNIVAQAFYDNVKNDANESYYIFNINNTTPTEVAIDRIEDFAKIEKLEEIVFIGKHKVFREIEKIFQNKYSEVKIIWQ